MYISLNVNIPDDVWNRIVDEAHRRDMLPAEVARESAAEGFIQLRNSIDASRRVGSQP